MSGITREAVQAIGLVESMGTHLGSIGRAMSWPVATPAERLIVVACAWLEGPRPMTAEDVSAVTLIPVEEIMAYCRSNGAAFVLGGSRACGFVVMASEAFEYGSAL